MVDGRWVEFSLADLAVDYGLIAANGSFASYDELYARGISTFMSENGIAYASEADHAAGLPLGEEAQRFIHGSRYPEIVRREAGIIGGLLAAMFGLWDWLAIPAGTRAKRVGLWHGVAT